MYHRSPAAAIVLTSAIKLPQGMLSQAPAGQAGSANQSPNLYNALVRLLRWSGYGIVIGDPWLFGEGIKEKLKRKLPGMEFACA